MMISPPATPSPLCWSALSAHAALPATSEIAICHRLFALARLHSVGTRPSYAIGGGPSMGGGASIAASMGTAGGLFVLQLPITTTTPSAHPTRGSKALPIIRAPRYLSSPGPDQLHSAADDRARPDLAAVRSLRPHRDLGNRFHRELMRAVPVGVADQEIAVADQGLLPVAARRARR